MKQYINLDIELREESYEFAYTALSGYPIAGIEERQDQIIVSFPALEWNDDLREKLLSDLKEYDENVRIKSEELITEKNWNEDWEKNVKVVKITDGITITPSWKSDEVDSPFKIIIDPKMSFGTGEHSTTRLICKLMEKVVRPSSFWIDAGTGTGVLAILALKLGAGNCFAFDNNEWSIQNAKDNISLNNLDGKIELVEVDIDDLNLPDADGITANLFAHMIKRNAHIFFNSLKKSKGDLLCSGILIYDKNMIIESAEKAGFTLKESLTEDEWIAFHFKA